MNDQLEEIAKGRLKQIFSFLRELTKIKTPPISRLQAYEWGQSFSKLPAYPTIQIGAIPEGDEEFDGVVLRVRRPKETACPAPQESLLNWLAPGWEQLENEATYIPAKNITDKNGQTLTENFNDDRLRVTEFQEWNDRREKWKTAEIPARAASEVFSNFFELHGRLQRESEKYQLYLGNGVLVWQSAVGQVDHPVLLKKLELEFNSSVPEFLLRETDDTPELYNALLRHHQLDGLAIRDINQRLIETEVHPLARQKTGEYFKFLIQRFFKDGQYIETREDNQGNFPSIFQDPVVFLGTRAQGLAEALDRLIDNLPEMKFAPEALMRVAGIEKQQDIGSNNADNDGITAESDPEIDFLLTKPANQEQQRIITRLEKSGSVLVQGPPGTGKSHTIANIIGHLLANGKTILVTSHTAKALRVVREKVVDPLRPLCVSVLDNDQESKAQLEESINGIVTYLSKTDSQSLTLEIAARSRKRADLKEKLKAAETEALHIRKSEYTDIIVAGEGVSPSEAARRVHELEKNHAWIPGPLEDGAPLSLTEEELRELYTTNERISPTEENCLQEGVPELTSLPKPSEAAALFTEISAIDAQSANYNAGKWQHSNQDPVKLSALRDQLHRIAETFSSHDWIHRVIGDSSSEAERQQPWLSLIAQIRQSNQDIATRSELIFAYGPSVPVEAPNELEATNQALATCLKILDHLKSGNSLGFLSTLFRGDWKLFMERASVDGGKPSKPEHFESLVALLETRRARLTLKTRWERQVTQLGGPSLHDKEPELTAKQFLTPLEFATSWSKSWGEIEATLTAQGLEIASSGGKLQASATPSTYSGMIRDLINQQIIPTIDARLVWLNLRELTRLKDQLLGDVQLYSGLLHNSREYLIDFAKALETLDSRKYESAYYRYLEIKGKKPVFDRRKSLLERLARVAPSWAKCIEIRQGIHALSTSPQAIDLAWKVAQWRQELEKRHSQNYQEVQRKISGLKQELAQVNAEYVEKLAWRYQQERTGLKEQQALKGWQQIQNKITKSGTGKKDAQLKRESRRLLRDCKEAVPVWIMPLSRAYESFELGHPRFDVLILDEASQSDITALAAFTIAKQVLVVGDDKQVTPLGSFTKIDPVLALIQQMLQGIPNRLLYDGSTSVYDLAAQSFGETIRLVEHFRCVPDIIEFSNQLSYNGEIKPLREATSSPFSRHVVAHRITSTNSDKKRNFEEANEVAAMVAAMTQMPEYSNSSIGVIGLLGTEQPLLIDSILQRRIPMSAYSKHSILCGIPPQFQGDERDVILLSMVDTCQAPPLSMRQDDKFKKRFNVAASRARNQLWVVHSLNPTTDLKPGDLRLRLIHHAENPGALKAAITATQMRADPRSQVFEQGVIADLMNAGFRITPQFSVGAYVIDIVVEGARRRIAVECDGDRYHPPERLSDDIQRQMVLERLGWHFIRIRGSEYFRGKESTIKRVVAELESLGIEKLGPKGESEPSFIENDRLREQLLIKAQELKTQWLKDPLPTETNSPKKTRWTRSTSAFDGALETNEGQDSYDDATD